MFTRSRKPLLTFLLTHHIRMTSEIKVDFWSIRTREYWWLMIHNFLKMYVHWLWYVFVIAGDCLAEPTSTMFPSWAQGMQFSTYDADHDTCPFSCASNFKGAWWYSCCLCGNLNGLYLRGDHTSYFDGMDWELWTGSYYSLQFSEMKIALMPWIYLEFKSLHMCASVIQNSILAPIRTFLEWHKRWYSIGYHSINLQTIQHYTWKL